MIELIEVIKNLITYWLDMGRWIERRENKEKLIAWIKELPE